LKESENLSIKKSTSTTPQPQHCYWLKKKIKINAFSINVVNKCSFSGLGQSVGYTIIDQEDRLSMV
jgi:hypothetical protein